MSRFRWVATVVLVIVAGSLVAVGCAGVEERSSSATEQPTRERHGGVLRFGLSAPPLSLDPVDASVPDDFVVQRALFAGLTRLDEDHEPELDLARTISVAKDHRSARITLREDIAWSDGSPLTAEQVVASWRAAFANPDSYTIRPAVPYFKNAEAVFAGDSKPDALGAVAVDERTIDVEFDVPTTNLARILTLPALAPRPNDALTDTETWWQKPGMLSSGAFTLTSDGASIDERIRMKRNPRYWNAARVDLDAIDIEVFDALHGVASGFLAGKLDAGSANIDSKDIDRLRDAGTFFLEPSHSTTVLVLVTDDQPVLRDQRVREAISLAIDRGKLTHDDEEGSQASQWITPPGVANAQFVRDADRDDRDRKQPDIARAKELLKQAGVRPGVPIRILAYYPDAHYDEDAIAASLKKVGFAATVKLPTDPDEYDEVVADPRGKGVEGYITVEDALTTDAASILTGVSCAWGTRLPEVCASGYDRQLRKVFEVSPEQRPAEERRAENLLTGAGGLFVQIPLYHVAVPMIFADHIDGDVTATLQDLYLDGLRFASASAAEQST